MHFSQKQLKNLKRKEVMNKMAIDYKNEWEVFRGTYGLNRIEVGRKKVHVKQLMDNQIQKTIGKREALMKEYIKTGLKTDITGGGRIGHIVNVTTRGITFGNIVISKKDFAKWCERKDSECMQKFGMDPISYDNLDIICKKCGQRLGRHNGIKCPTKGGK